MALKPKIEVKVETIRIKVPAAVQQEVLAYAKFLGGDTTADYVYVEAVKKEMRSDKAFHEARHAPKPGPTAPRAETSAHAAASQRTA